MKGRPTVDAQLAGAVAKLDAALQDLGKATAGTRPTRLNVLCRAVHELLDHADGIDALAERALRVEEAGVFAHGAWSDPSKLLPHLVAGGLLADDTTAAIELLSEVRMLAIAEGRLQSSVSRADAREFLREVVVRNLALLSEGGTEDERNRAKSHVRARQLLQFLIDHLSPALVRDALVAELDELCAQRPILTRRARLMIERAAQLPRAGEHRSEERLELYRLAVSEPSPLSQLHRDTVAYQRALGSADAHTLDQEVRAFATSLRLTGVGNAYHSLLLRQLAADRPTRIGAALGLDAVGEANLAQQADLVGDLIHVAISPETCDSIYGLARVLERGVLSRRVVAKSLRRLIQLTLHTSATRSLMGRLEAGSSLHANALLVAGTIGLLGQPLGVGQGNNPTCQSARALSLWSLHAPGYLLSLLIQAARDGAVQLDFEGLPLRSDQLTGGLAPKLDVELDPVSLILVPHLDRLYDAMVARASGRGQDPHRWVNPAFYGRWVPTGFSCAIDPVGTVVRYEAFLRGFFATHHPAYNDGDDLLYPNPVGILVTDVHGNLLGPHAVSLLRVEPDPHGDLRAYFFNPNNEGRQNWGRGVAVSVSGNGEVPGESSLPFAQFASRLYAYHFHPQEGGDAEAVPDAVIAAVTEASKQSWGRSYRWLA